MHIINNFIGTKVIESFYTYDINKEKENTFELFNTKYYKA